MGGYTVGVAGQTVNLLSSDSGGSTPSPPTQDDLKIVEIGFSRQKREVISSLTKLLTKEYHGFKWLNIL